MKKYKVLWIKRYYVTGEVIVEADSPDHAQHIVNLRVGDYEGATQSDPLGTDIEVIEEVSDE